MMFRMATIAGFFWPINFSIKHFVQKSSELWKEEPGTERRWSFSAGSHAAGSWGLGFSHEAWQL
jgi:hypothetical protein